MALSLKHQAFIAAYLGEANGNATEAARIAGYKQPRMHGSRLMTNDVIRGAVEEHLAAIKRQGIAHKQNRIDALVRRHQLLDQVIAERAEHDWTDDVPGGKTGVVVKQLKSVKHVYEKDPSDPKSEAHQVTVELWESSVDTGLLKEMREHEKQVAQELGEWTEKSEVYSSVDAHIQIRSISVPLPARDDGSSE